MTHPVAAALRDPPLSRPAASPPLRSGARVAPALEQGFRTRAEREGADEALLARHDADPALTPAILSIRPAPGSAVRSRLERDMDVIRAGLEAGRVAVLQALDVAL